VAGYESIHPGKEIYLAAPTGRAAKRLSEATRKEAKTIHRLLGYNPELGFSYDEYNQLQGPGLLIIDESSMIDLELAHNLFKAVPDDMQVVIIGDVDQLPSVGPGAVLRDVIQSGVVPVTELKFIYRQAEGSTISLLADMIKNYGRETGEVDRQGKKIKIKNMPNLMELEAMSRTNGARDFIFIEAETPEDVYRAVQRLITDQYATGLDPMDFMVLTPLRDRGLASAEKLNAMIRDIVNPAREGRKEKKFGDKVFRDGDKVMKVKKNDYNKSLFNGDIGILEVAGGDGKREEIAFILDGVPVPLSTEDLAYIEPAYSYTTHKSQGSESPTVIVVCIRSHYIMLSKPIVYTGITRGKVRLAVVGTQDAFEVAVKNNKVVRRYGLLKERLRGEIGIEGSLQ
jgi:exodeoxyribonuclease V alpha subunit